MLTKRRRLVSLVLTLTLLLMACSAALFWMPAKTVKADAGDNYPWKDASSIPGKGDWGYTSCPSNDPNCMVAKETGSDGNVYGMADPWRVYLRYCTSWVAWALHDRNGFEIPGAFGYAKDWAMNATSDHYTVNSTPANGVVAQWNAYPWNGYAGHVAWVETVNSSTSIVVEEYNFTNPGGWDQRTVTTSGKNSAMWPDNFIHFKDLSGSGTPNPTPTATPTPIPSTPVAVSRASTNMAVFYNDGANHLVNWSFDASYGWSSQQWSDDIVGQPCAIARDANDMDVFYRTAEGKLIHRGWNASGNWGLDVLISSDVAGDPACVTRDSGDMQVFYRTSEGDIKSVYWNASTGWNLNPQLLYSSAATSDPVAISRTADSMDVFFGKNNGNLVHLGWSAAYGWVTQDWSAGSGLTGKPTAMTYNTGGDMNAVYQENNGYVATEYWDWRIGWSWEHWPAQLVGSPSAIAGVTNIIDVFYRESGGNIVDRAYTGSDWITNNIVGTGGATGNPYGIVRGTNEEVFYWNNSALMDANWNGSAWSTSRIN